MHTVSPQTLLDHDIRQFLLSATRWTIRWFNKPKFHILLHLTEHIRWFGPAILFATEAFESFNAIIRAKSVHSNQYAPSRDIALAFAQSNRICHLLSSGHFNIQLLAALAVPVSSSSSPSVPTLVPEAKSNFSFKPEDWRCAGEGVWGLVHVANTATRYLGLDDKKPTKTGQSSVKISDLSNLTLIYLFRILCLRQEANMFFWQDSHWICNTSHLKHPPFSTVQNMPRSISPEWWQMWTWSICCYQSPRTARVNCCCTSWGDTPGSRLCSRLLTNARPHPSSGGRYALDSYYLPDAAPRFDQPMGSGKLHGLSIILAVISAP
jgi:hypothetical protein